MPDPYDRHGRNRDPDWGTNPPRSRQRAAAAEDEKAKRPPGKKDRNLCKAAHWKGPHTWELRIRQLGWRRGMKCGWDVAWSGERPAYFCQHEAYCTGCGKVQPRDVAFEDCPGREPLTPERRAVIEAKIEERRERTARYRARHHRDIDGPQGYRKQKKENTDVQG